MADSPVNDNLPEDCEHIEREIAKVRFADEDNANNCVTSSDGTDNSRLTVDDGEETEPRRFTTSESDVDTLSAKSVEGHPVSSILKSATVAAVSEYAGPADPAASLPDPFETKSKSSPEVLVTAGYKSEMEKMLATHMDVTHVLDHLYLSDYISLSASRLTELGVTLVVNATHEIPNIEVADGNVEFMKLDVNDVPTADIAQHMDVCADRIRDVRNAGGVALVHCALGISRSVTICLAYLVKYEGRTLREAYFEVKKKRPIIRPNEGFWRQLIAFETAKCGRATVKLSVYPMGVIPDVYRGAPNSVTARRYHHF